MYHIAFFQNVHSYAYLLRILVKSD